MTSQIENIASDKFSIGAEALLIRDYWKENIKERKYVFDFPEEENDPWITLKKPIFEDLLKKEILKEWPEQEYSNEKIGILNNVKIDEYYKNILYMIWPWEFKIDKQDEWTRILLAKLLENYSEDNVINIFSTFDTSEEVERYITVCNPILSLLRTEYEKYITIEKIFKFSYKTRWKKEWDIKVRALKELSDTKTLAFIPENKQRRIHFDKKSGDVYYDDELLWNITIGKKEFYFFEFLYDNYKIAMSHKDIAEYLRTKWVIDKRSERNSGEQNLYCSSAKRHICQEIKDYIWAPSGHYQILEMKK